LPRRQDREDRQSSALGVAPAEAEPPDVAGHPLAWVLNSVMAALTLGAVASFAVAVGRILR